MAIKTPKQALDFVEHHGVVLLSARGRVPNLVEAVAGEPIRGSWWGHPKSHAIYAAQTAVRDSPDILVCRLIDGKVTFVHHRLWPELVRVASKVPSGRLDPIREEHTPSGAHRLITFAFPRWVPKEVLAAAKQLSENDVADFRDRYLRGLRKPAPLNFRARAGR